MLLGDGQLRLLDVGEDSQAALVEALPGVRQVHPAGRAAEQLDGQTLLQVRQPPADRRLGCLEALRRPGDAAGFHHPDEGAHLL